MALRFQGLSRSGSEIRGSIVELGENQIVRFLPIVQEIRSLGELRLLARLMELSAIDRIADEF